MKLVMLGLTALICLPLGCAVPETDDFDAPGGKADGTDSSDAWGTAGEVCLQSAKLTRDEKTERGTFRIPMSLLQCPAGLVVKVTHVRGDGTVGIESVKMGERTISRDQAREIERDWVLGSGRERVNSVINRDSALQLIGEELTGKTVNRGAFDLSWESVESEFLVGFPSDVKTTQGCNRESAALDALHSIYDDAEIEISLVLEKGDNPCVEVRWDEAGCGPGLWDDEANGQPFVEADRAFCGGIEADTDTSMTEQLARSMCAPTHIDCWQPENSSNP